MFFNLLTTRIKLMFNKLGFKLSFSIMLIYSLATNVYYSIIYINKDTSEICNAIVLFSNSARSVFIGYFQMIFPFIIILPFCYSYLIDKKNKIISILEIRSNKLSYYFANSITCFIGGFIILAIPLLINFLINIFSFPLNSVLDDTNLPTYSFERLNGFLHNYLFLDQYIHNPIIYNIIYILIPAIFAGVACQFVYAMSFFNKYYKIILFLPFYTFHGISVFISNKLDAQMTHNKEVYYMRYINALDAQRNKDFSILIIIMVIMLVTSYLLILYQSKRDEFN